MLLVAGCLDAMQLIFPLTCQVTQSRWVGLGRMVGRPVDPIDDREMWTKALLIFTYLRRSLLFENNETKYVFAELFGKLSGNFSEVIGTITKSDFPQMKVKRFLTVFGILFFGGGAGGFLEILVKLVL